MCERNCDCPLGGQGKRFAMIPALLGKKIGMTQVFDDGGTAVPVTIIQAGPCTIMQVRERSRDGYDAVQLGFEDTKPHRATLAAIGHARRAKTTPKRYTREVRLEEAPELSAGDVLTVQLFAEQGVQFVDVVATSKGHGFTGSMKRHNFGGQPASHGVERKHRSPGSISSHGSDLGKGGNLKKGKRMAGHHGHARITVKNQQLIDIDPENNLLLIRGGVPGPSGGLVYVRQAKTKGAASAMS